MNLFEATTYCFRNALKFSGRADRYEYWNFVLFIIAMSVVLVIVNSVIFGPTITEGVSFTVSSDGTQSTQSYRHASFNAGLLGNIFAVIVFLPLLSVGWRRLHDIGRAGWLVLLPHAFLGVMAALWYLTSEPIVVGTHPQTGEQVTALLPSSIALIAVPGALALISFIVVFVWLCRQSELTSNQYGPNPNEASS